MKNKTVIILGSSRSNGDTRKVIEYLNNNNQYDIIDLNTLNFSYFDYEHKNKDDDFIPLMREIIAKYDTLIFATPVYWYSMSGILKVFFDRITDLITIEKELGRQLRGKNMGAISCSIGNNLGETFWMPFEQSANYLGMNYLGHVHTEVENDAVLKSSKKIIDAFRNLF